jgi:hypothetical protein
MHSLLYTRTEAGLTTEDILKGSPFPDDWDESLLNSQKFTLWDNDFDIRKKRGVEIVYLKQQ